MIFEQSQLCDFLLVSAHITLYIKSPDYLDIQISTMSVTLGGTSINH